MNVNRLILGDNLEIMKTMDSETIEIIRLKINGSVIVQE